MKQTRLLMGMPITLEIIDPHVTTKTFDLVYAYFKKVDDRYSTYKDTSEISRINRGLDKRLWSREMKQVMVLCEQTKRETDGYFDINHKGYLDPSGLVKGWAINKAADLLRQEGFRNFYVDAGGDIQACGHNDKSKSWRVGLRNPFNRQEIIKTVAVTNKGVATSGTYIRGEHVYNPKVGYSPVNEIVAITVIGPNIYDADRFATAAFAMGSQGISFIESLDGFEAYSVDHSKRATMTSDFERYVL